MKLLIDVGNTRLKWALWSAAALEQAGAIAHAAQAPDFAAAWSGLPNVDSIWVASVASSALNDALAGACASRFHIPAQFVHSRAQACGVRNAYVQPERLGVDRFLALIAAHAQLRAPVVIVSCGTALTLDALAADGLHLGGLIAASPELTLAALRGGTANLSIAPPGRIVEIADNTADAMESGAWLAAAALVERFFAQAKQHIGTAPSLVLTGGGASRLGALLTHEHRIDSDLVLLGLAHFADSGG
jgi:type III pantothenate kinase